MTERIIVAGAGGQGILLLGKIIAMAAMREGKFTVWLPSYGPEVRGGTAHCMTTISDAEIGSPFIERADALIIMNALSLARFQDRIQEKGLLIVNSSLAALHKKINAEVVSRPFTDTALSLGNIQIANIVALGCFLATKKILDPKTVIGVIEDIAPPDKRGLVEINKKALYAGIGLCTCKKGIA